MIKHHPVYFALAAQLFACGAGQITDQSGGGALGGSTSSSAGGSTSDPASGGVATTNGGSGTTANGGSGTTGDGGSSTGDGGSSTTSNGGAATTGNGGQSSSANGGATGIGSGGTCATDALPAVVQSMLTNKCVACHGSVPITGVPSLVTYADLTRAAASDAAKTNAEVALARIQNSASPMPPAPGASATAAEVAALSQFISAGYPKASCPTGGSGGSASTGGAGAVDPLSAAPTCTSNTRWTQGNEGSASMNPGEACINCHKTTGGEGPSFSIAGTVYPTGHEPDLCNSKVGTSGAQVVIVGADGQTVTLTPNSAGNFSLRTSIKTPYQAKVTFQGRERLMLSAQTSGDCNSCHTQTGANGAPGRVTVP
ncbi:MAG TPA: c-type cytochrome [Polyangiaceae bacterium]|nr:c-type cytochrome [Polyangiaceae bacterium]